jgi:hypothetical protein
MPWTSEFWMQTFREPASFWAMAAAIFTALIAVVAYKQLGDLAQSSKSDFLYRLKKDFFTEEARRLMFLVDNDLLEFRAEEIPFFQVVKREDASMSERFRELGVQSATISTYLVDDVLLGPLEDLGVLERLKRVSLEEAYEHFASYIEGCAENKAILEYIQWSKDDPEI